MSPLGDGTGLYLVVNPRSGATRHRPDPVPIVAARLPGATVHVLAEGEDLGDVLRRRPGADRTTVLGVSGGDGSVSAAAAVALDDGLPLLVLPGGTDNHFARLIGLDSIDVALAAAAGGRGGGVDLARVTPHDEPPVIALNTLNIGLYPRFVRLRERLEPRLGRLPAMLGAAVVVAIRSSPLSVELDGRPIAIWTIFVGVDGYLPQAGAPMRRAAAQGAVLDVRFLLAGPVHRLAGAIGALRGGRDQLGPRTRRLEQRRVARIEIAGSGGRPDLAHDGEAVHPRSRRPYRATIEVLPDAIQVYRPV